MEAPAISESVFFLRVRVIGRNRKVNIRRCKNIVAAAIQILCFSNIRLWIGEALDSMCSVISFRFGKKKPTFLGFDSLLNWQEKTAFVSN
jgi:hypothetical protein